MHKPYMRAQNNSTADLYNRNSKQQELTKTTQTAVSNRAPHQQFQHKKKSQKTQKQNSSSTTAPEADQKARNHNDLQLTQQL